MGLMSCISLMSPIELGGGSHSPFTGGASNYPLPVFARTRTLMRATLKH
jgi:hypothetical protein